MSRFIVASFSFDASHRDQDEGPHLHGHHFTVEVTEQTEVRSLLREHMAEIRDQLHLHDLGEMLVGGSPTGQGIASWVMERLLINHPKITRVEAWWEPDFRYVVTREVR